jgi:hypothetical protein
VDYLRKNGCEAVIPSCSNFKKKTRKSTWFLFSSLSPKKEFSDFYKKRFSIEKYFQDQKSSGFDIEKTEIKKYDGFKKLYFSVVCCNNRRLHSQQESSF